MSAELRAHSAEILRPLEEQSGNERIKASSRQLRGTLAEELRTDAPVFSDAAGAVLKFHGVYQQEDRDARRRARHEGGDRQHIMMVRTRIPGGVAGADAYLAHDRIATRFGNGSLRITSRQDFQTHGVLKGDLAETIREINRTLLTTLGGCGDQERNVMCCPLPRGDVFGGEVREAVARLARGLTPTTQAYTEIWLDGERVAGEEPAVDELYGATYLPRKFKTAVAIEGDNCVDVYTNDLGLVARRAPGGGLAGFTVLVGGGLGRTHGKTDTYPALGQPLADVAADQVVDLARAVVGIHRDYGNRRDRRHARLKYVLAERGLDWFRARVAERVGFTLADPRELRWDPVEDHLGWHDQGDGRFALGIFVENGRVTGLQREALRRIVAAVRPRVILTPQQNVILAGIHPADRGRVEELLATHAQRPLRALPMALRDSMACPALPTCGLAVAEAERVMPDLVRELGHVAVRLGLGAERISYRMTGCPNGCVRPYVGDVGIVGTTLGKYDIHLGGDTEGSRLNSVYARNVPLARIAGMLGDVLAVYARERGHGEGFGDWCHRVGVDRLTERLLHGPAMSGTAQGGEPPVPARTTAPSVREPAEAVA